MGGALTSSAKLCLLGYLISEKVQEELTTKDMTSSPYFDSEKAFL